jgi:hypothetical protein
VPTVAILAGPTSRIDVLRDIRHRLKCEDWLVPKRILRRGAARSGLRFDEGADYLVGGGDVCRVGVMTDCWLAHFPVRSIAQFEQKIIRSWHARLIHRPTPDTSSHWQHIYEGIVSNGSAMPELVRRIAADYQRQRGDWKSLRESDLVEDPLDRSPDEAGPLLRAASGTPRLSAESR